MNIDIKSYVKDNFKNTSKEDIKQSIEEALKKGDDIALPGLGVLFETLWNASDDECQGKIVDSLHSSFK